MHVIISKFTVRVGKSLHLKMIIGVARLVREEFEPLAPFMQLSILCVQVVVMGIVMLYELCEI